MKTQVVKETAPPLEGEAGEGKIILRMSKEKKK